MYQPEDVQRVFADAKRQERRERDAGIDMSVCYWTIKGVVQKGRDRGIVLSDWTVRQAVKSGELAAVRLSGHGLPALIHPDEGTRWLNQKEEEQNAEES